MPRWSTASRRNLRVGWTRKRTRFSTNLLTTGWWPMNREFRSGAGRALPWDAQERAGNHFAEWSRRRPELWQGLPPLPPGRPKVSIGDSRRETYGPAHGGVWRPAPNRHHLEIGMGFPARSLA